GRRRDRTRPFIPEEGRPDPFAVVAGAGQGERRTLVPNATAQAPRSERVGRSARSGLGVLQRPAQPSLDAAPGVRELRLEPRQAGVGVWTVASVVDGGGLEHADG